MTAHIKIEIEGTPKEVEEALEVLHPQNVSVLVEGVKVDDFKMGPLPVIEDWSGAPEVIVPAEKLDEAEAPHCKYCGKLLNAQQIKAKGKYCSLKCANLGKPRKAPDPHQREPKKLSEKVKALTGRSCLECGKDLTKDQKKFCSKLHSNRYHLRERQAAREASEKESHSPRTK